MPEKYSANLDKVLLDFISKKKDDSNKIVFSENVKRGGDFKKVAYDVYRKTTDPYNNLWSLENINGTQYLVRMSEPKFEENKHGDWTVVSNYDKDNVILAYKNIPVTIFKSNDFKFTSDNLFLFKESLLESINDADFVKNVLLEQPEDKKTALLSSFPELKKFI